MRQYKFRKTWDEMSDEEKLTCITYFPKEAKQDKDRFIRLKAYRALGYTEEAKQDESWDIRQEAELFFSLVEEDNETV